MSAEPARLLLGELLVHKGVLTEAQLDVALEEQRQCGKPLGEILVRLGFSTGPAIANALAEQHGGPLRTEYGLSLGPTHVVPAPMAALSNPHEQRDAEARLRAELDEKTQELARVHADLASAAGQVAAATAELAQARRELETLRGAGEPPADRHLIFVPGAEGYLMVDRTGPAPQVGAVLEIGGISYSVARAGASTLLGVPIGSALLARS